VLAAVAILMIAVEGINLATIWGISFVVDGVSAKGAAAFHPLRIFT
jgi:ATP-binding cassette, subfamily B, multidrug efflux pump